MEKVQLGNTGIWVSRLCFGSLTLGPVQAKLPVKQGAEVLAYAIEKGINFTDTAQLYETYPYIKRAMELTQKHDLVVSTKTYAYTRELAVEAVEQARRELNRDYIDVFMLHEQESSHTLRGHSEALEYLFECKQKGIIHAVGASMHHIAAVYGAMERKLDVIHPLLNYKGLGIVDGSRAEMEEAIAKAHAQGMGVFSMKAFGGGNLFRQAGACLDYITKFSCVDAVAMGMQCKEEVDANLCYFEQGRFSPQMQKKLENRIRHLHIDDWCEGCGACVARCGQGAMSLHQGTAVCNAQKCILCGYCCKSCPAWAIKVV